MASFLRTLLKKTSLSSSQSTDTSPPLPFDENPCLACLDPCNHPKIPDYLLKKIDHKEPLEGTVKPHQRHILVCTGQTDWPTHPEDENNSLVKYLSAAAKEIQDDQFKWSVPDNTHPPSRIVVTAISRPTTGKPAPLPFLPAALSPSAPSSRHDVILLPEGLLIPSLPADPAAVNALFDTWLGQNHEYNSLPLKNALGACTLPYNWIVLTCGHKKRDKRCGVAGPMIAETFERELAKKGFSSNMDNLEEKTSIPDGTEADEKEEGKVEKNKKQNVGVWLCSHTGGHKFAGNVIVYPGGIWYGRVQPCHVPCIVERHLIGGHVVREFYRGKFDGPENGRTVAW